MASEVKALRQQLVFASIFWSQEWNKCFLRWAGLLPIHAVMAVMFPHSGLMQLFFFDTWQVPVPAQTLSSVSYTFAAAIFRHISSPKYSIFAGSVLISKQLKEINKPWWVLYWFGVFKIFKWKVVAWTSARTNVLINTTTSNWNKLEIHQKAYRATLYMLWQCLQARILQVTAPKSWIGSAMQVF